VKLAAITLAAFALFASAASAHATVIPASARPGETRTLTFRVPNERDGAQTVRVEVFVPAGVPAKPGVRRGWSAAHTGREIDWTADTPDDAISGDSPKDFQLGVGPLPHADRLVFKVLQHYSDGDVVRWIQDPTAGGDRPAPTLQLTATGRPGTASGSSSSAAGWAVLAVFAAAAAGAALIAGRRRRR
jgi:periplasmic copper chaperone A